MIDQDELRITNYKLRIAFLVLLAICFSASGVFTQTLKSVTVQVSGEKAVEKDVIKLSDIAEISGDPEKILLLQSVSLGYAPNFGAIREIPRSRILLAISAVGLAENEFSLEAQPIVRLTRIGQIVSQELLRESCEKAVSQLFENNGVTIKFNELDLPSNLIVPTGSIEVFARPSSLSNFAAPFAIAIEIKIEGHIVRRLTATAQIEAFANVLIATHDLPANSKISESDVKLENRRLNKPLANYVREFKNLRGTVSLRNLTGGTEITAETVTAGIVIKSGDTVRVVGESGKLQIVISGEARAAGRIGDRIAVKNLQSGAILQAFVVDEGVVQIRF